MNWIIGVAAFLSGFFSAPIFIWLIKKADKVVDGHAQPLFKTNDGVQMFIGDRYWYIGIDSYNRLKLYSVKICSEQDCCKGFCQFSTREKAEEQLCFYSDDREKGEE